MRKGIVGFCKRKEKDRRRKKKTDRVGQAENPSCGEQSLPNAGVAQWNSPDQSINSRRRTQTQE